MRALLVSLLLIASSCASPETVTVSGSVAVFDFLYHYDTVVDQAEQLAGEDFFALPEEVRDELWVEALPLTVGRPCTDIGDFGDIRSGTPVSVGVAGATIGSGVLGPGFTDLVEDEPGHFVVVCRFDFQVAVPAADRYEVTVAGTPPVAAVDGEPVMIYLGFSRPPKG